MTPAERDPAGISGYHAHIYFDPASRPRAEILRERIGARFAVRLGRWHDQPVGPHPQGMYQVVFAAGQFAALVPWLALNRDGLDILVHPKTGDDVADHTDHAIWLGARLPLDIDSLR
jgi:aromatic ring-cleaving dioxygenase